MPNISVIVGSTRPTRFADKPAAWIQKHLAARPGVRAELLDLADHPLPFFAEAVAPAMKRAPYADPAIEAWAAKVGAADGFVIVTPEYNHSFPAVLKNALDHVYAEWARKAVAFIGYGAADGIRPVEQLRQVVVELQMAPVRNSVQLPFAVLKAVHQGTAPAEALAAHDGAAARMIDDLLWWAEALRAARTRPERQPVLEETA